MASRHLVARDSHLPTNTTEPPGPGPLTAPPETTSIQTLELLARRQVCLTPNHFVKNALSAASKKSEPQAIGEAATYGIVVEAALAPDFA